MFKDLRPDQAARVERRAELTMRSHLVFSQMKKPVMGISGDLQLGYLRSLVDLSGLSVRGQGQSLVPVFRDSVPATFLYHARGVQGMNRRLEGVRMDIRGELAGLAAWRLR